MANNLEQHRPLGVLLLRVLGVYFSITGVSGVIRDGFETLSYLQIRSAGDPFTILYNLSHFLSSAFLVAVGAYLVFKGQFFIDAIFHESIEDPPAPPPSLPDKAESGD